MLEVERASPGVLSFQRPEQRIRLAGVDGSSRQQEMIVCPENSNQSTISQVQKDINDGKELNRRKRRNIKEVQPTCWTCDWRWPMKVVQTQDAYSEAGGHGSCSTGSTDRDATWQQSHNSDFGGPKVVDLKQIRLSFQQYFPSNWNEWPSREHWLSLRDLDDMPELLVERDIMLIKLLK